MEIKINDQLTIEEIQKRFSEHFPFLNLEFYSRMHEPGEGSAERVKLGKSLTIGAARTLENAGEISIRGNQKVSTLEQSFHEHYGLNVQVFRKSANVWIQTTTTDDWTLSEQNKKGEEMAL